MSSVEGLQVSSLSYGTWSYFAERTGTMRSAMVLVP
jgi:hypothetical protein